MSAPTLDEVLAALKQALGSIDGLRAHATEPDEPNFPTAYPRLVDLTYDATFSEGCDETSTLYHFDIWVLVDIRPGLQRAQTQLNPYIAPVGRRSVKAAVERDQSLGGCVDYAILTGGATYGLTDFAGLRCLAASMRCEVMT
jgi:hypothetical protein